MHHREAISQGAINILTSITFSSWLFNVRWQCATVPWKKVCLFFCYGGKLIKLVELALESRQGNITRNFPLLVSTVGFSGHFLVSIIRVIITVIVSTLFFRSFIHSFTFSHRVPSNLFQKLLLHIFEKLKRMESQLVWLLVPGRFFSLYRNWRRMAIY